MGADYDMENPLCMHTDHTVYQGTPGFLQWLYQAKGSVRTKVCDGYAIANFIKENHPEEYETLTTVEITHSSRNTLYTKEGCPRSVYDDQVKPAAFELVHTHPTIQLAEDGTFEKLVQSETKRGISAIPYEMHDKFMCAYKLWIDLIESDEYCRYFDWPEGSVVVTNNWRVLHGRAIIAPHAERTMITGYQNRPLVENRYRYLKQQQAAKTLSTIEDHWMTAAPDHVLNRLIM